MKRFDGYWIQRNVQCHYDLDQIGQVIFADDASASQRTNEIAEALTRRDLGHSSAPPSLLFFIAEVSI